MIKDTNIFISLDLANAYTQIPLVESACAKTAFITPDDTGEFTRAMLGLLNAPFYFSKLMSTIWITKNWQDLIQKLRLVLEEIKRAKLALRLSKCSFGMKKITFLGYDMSSKGIEPNQLKINALSKFPQPNNIHEVRRFQGLAGFFRKFITRFTTFMAPFSQLLRKDVQFNWVIPQEQAFTLRACRTQVLHAF